MIKLYFYFFYFFFHSPRQLILEPRKALEACDGGDDEGKSEASGGVEVLVIVPSSPSNLAARSAVRESWGAYLPPNWALVFYVGAVERASVQVCVCGMMRLCFYLTL